MSTFLKVEPGQQPQMQQPQMNTQGYPYQQQQQQQQPQQQPTGDYAVDPQQDSSNMQYPAYPHPSAASNMAYPRQQAAMPQQPPANLDTITGHRSGLSYTLVIQQQPDRARMCGFGDKDRRPITPPPCVKLVIADQHTGKEIEYSQIDSHHYILQVDLWNPEGNAAVNCVQHSNTSPSVSISMATTTSYPPQPDQTHSFMMHGMGGQGAYGMHPNQQGYNHYQGPMGGYQFAAGGNQGMQPTMAGPSGNYTRNLIGSCSVSAYSLSDLQENNGLWFVLQDLSVRTEGSFRLKFSFINVGEPDGTLNDKVSPVLSTCFSDVFTVWSAKKFPGVKESTPLSKCFAAQGVKIPIRKDGGGKGGKGVDGEDFEGDE